MSSWSDKREVLGLSKTRGSRGVEEVETKREKSGLAVD